jgi:hypothetical protein
LGDLGIDGRITLKWVLKKRYEDVNWIHLAQDKLQWQAHVNTFRFHKKWDISYLAE